MFTFTSQNQNQHEWSCLLLFPFPEPPLEAGLQSAVLEPTQLRRHLALPEVILHLSLKAILSWAGPPLLNLLIMKKGHTWGREVFAYL